MIIINYEEINLQNKLIKYILLKVIFQIEL